MQKRKSAVLLGKHTSEVKKKKGPFCFKDLHLLKGKLRKNSYTYNSIKKNKIRRHKLNQRGR